MPTWVEDAPGLMELLDPPTSGTEGVPIGSGDWLLHVERMSGNAAGAVWDLDVWDADAGTPGFVTFPAIVGNWLSTPDAAAFDIVADLSLAVRAKATDWTPGAQQCLAGKWAAAGSRSYRLLVLPSGVLRFEWSVDGTAVLSADSTVATGVTDNTFKWVSVTFEANNGLAGRNIRFWTSNDGLSWTLLGTTVTQAGVTSIFASIGAFEIGSATGSTTDLFAGDIDNVQLFASKGDIFGGPLPDAMTGAAVRFQVYDADFAASPFTSASGHVMTLSTSGGTPATITAALNVDITEWAVLEWEPLVDVLRGMEWNRGADQPWGRPRNGEILLTLHNPLGGENDPWQQYGNTRPGTLLRAGITSATDIRADGWLPLWSGIVESWDVVHVAPRKSGYRADSFAEVRLVETLSWLARIDDNALGSPVGSGEKIVGRIDRLLDAAQWPFGLRTLFDGAGEPSTLLQSTDMALNRLGELYLTADSVVSAFFGVGGIVRSDTTGAALVTTRSAFQASRLIEFSSAFSGQVPQLQFDAFDDFGSAQWIVAYDADSVQSVNDPEGIVNDHRYTRVGGVQQVLEHVVSIGTFGRSTRARNDLICTTDAAALATARSDNNREARTALRIDNVDITATERPNVLLAVAAADIGDGVLFVPPTGAGFTGTSSGPIRTLTHTITPLKGRVHWTASYALDLSGFFDLPGSILPVQP